MKVVYLPIDELKHPAYNPRYISDEDRAQLLKSLERFDAVEPAVINTHKGREGFIIGGNQRIMVAQEDLGWKEFPCVKVSLTPAKEKELNVRLNRNTGMFDSKKLLANYDIGSLEDFGFGKNELKDHATVAGLKIDFDLSNDKDEIEEGGDVDAEGNVKVNETPANQVDDTSPYCSMHNCRIDIGHGWCDHNCAYCFTKMTPAGLQMKEGKYKLTTKKSILAEIKKARQLKTALTIGVANDPVLPFYRDRLIYVLQQCTQSKVHLCIQTKNPKIILQTVQECGADANLIEVKMTCAFYSDKWTQILEPGAPVLSARMKGFAECGKAGMDLIGRLQPFFIDYYEGLSKQLDIMAKAGVTRIIVSPLRVAATNKAHMVSLGQYLTKDGCSLDKYIERIVKKEQPMYGALHWYQYDEVILRKAYVYIKKLCNDRGMKFGICTGPLGIPFMDLNDGDFCCQTDRNKKDGLGYDKMSISSIYSSGEIDKLLIDGVRENKKLQEDAEYHMMIRRVAIVNDSQTYSLPPH